MAWTKQAIPARASAATTPCGSRFAISCSAATPTPPRPSHRTSDAREGERLAPFLPAAHEGLSRLMMNVLMVEIRAEKHFDFVERLLGDPETFAGAREKAEPVLVEFRALEPPRRAVA